MTRLSAIVPATNEPATLDRCVAAIRTAEEPPEEVIVVSEASAPGPAAARNEGAERATGASRPVYSLNWRAAWRRNMSTPVTTWDPRSRASLSIIVFSG